MGLYDIAYMLAVPEMTVTAPKDAHGDARRCLRSAMVHTSGPFCIRYPRDAAPDKPAAMSKIEPVPYAHVGSAASRQRRRHLRRRHDGAAVARRGRRARPTEGLDVTVVNCRYLKPYDEVTLAAVLADHKQILVVEEGTVVNGFGAYMSSVIARYDSGDARRGARRAGSRHSRGVARATARDVRTRRGGHREPRARAARERGDGGVIRLGVVGHLGYPGLPAVLRTLERARANARPRAVLRARAASRSPASGQLLEDPAQLDALLTLGGDGTLLRGARIISPHAGADPRHQSRAARLSHLLQRGPARRTR